MDIKYPDGRTWKKPKLTLASVEVGEVFRAANGELNDGSCLWMRTQNRSTDPRRAQMVRTVSLRAGSVDYKSPDMEVVRVKGSFTVEDWGE